MENKPTFQTTIAKEITLEGVGIHTGKNVVLTFKPAVSNTGYIFKRTDLEVNQLLKPTCNMSQTHKEVPI